jgi:hypothetical protein
MTALLETKHRLTLQVAYSHLLEHPDATIKSEFDDGNTIQYFEFVDPPSYTTAAQNGQKVMQTVTVWRVKDDPHAEEPKNHWGYLYPPSVVRLATMPYELRKVQS